MRHSLSLISLGLLAAMTLPLAAQDTQAPAEETTEETTGTPAEAEAPAAEAPAPGLDMGTAVETAPTAPSPGEYYLSAEHGDWALRCLYLPEQPDPCEMYQLLLGAEGNPVAEITVFPLPAGNGEAVAGATLVAPLETALTERITLSIDGGQARQYEFSFCNRAGCVAQIGLTAADLAAYKGGRAASMRIVPMGDRSQPFDLNISLAGFTAGFDATPLYNPEGEDEGPITSYTPNAEPAAEAAPAEGN